MPSFSGGRCGAVLWNVQNGYTGLWLGSDLVHDLVLVPRDGRAKYSFVIMLFGLFASPVNASEKALKG